MRLFSKEETACSNHAGCNIVMTQWKRVGPIKITFLPSGTTLKSDDRNILTIFLESHKVVKMSKSFSYIERCVQPQLMPPKL